MRIPWYFRLMSPEDSGTGGGGGGKSASAIATQLFNSQNNADNDGDGGDEDGDSTESGEDDSDHDGGDDSGDDSGKQSRKSWIAEHLKKLEDGDDEEEDKPKGKKTKGGSDKKGASDTTEEEESGEDDGEEKAKDKKSKPTEWDGKRSLTDEELLNLDPKGKDGKAITAQPAAAFRVMKDRLRTLSQEVTNLKSPEAFKVHTDKIAELTAQLTERDNKLKELSQQLDDEFFENSPGFIETYQKPVDESLKTMQEFFEHIDEKEDAEDYKAINLLFTKANRLAYSGKKQAYLEVMSELCDEYVKGGSLSKNAFGEACLKYFHAQKELANAKMDKESNRKTVVENRMMEMRSKSYASTEQGVNRFVKKFDADHKTFIENLDPDNQKKFRDSYLSNQKAVNQALAQYAATGKIPEALDTIIAKGVAMDAMEQKFIIFHGAFMDTYRKVEQLQKKLDEANGKLKKYTKEPDRNTGKTSGSSSPPPRKTGSAIANALAAQGHHDDDD